MLDLQTLALCNKINSELQVDRFNQRMTLIARCFEYDKFIGCDVRSVRLGDRLYWNNYFDLLMNKTLEELEEWEIKMFKISKDYGDTFNRYGQE